MTLAEKVWRDRVMSGGSDGVPDLPYIDLHLIHEVTSPQTFEGLRLAGRPVCHPSLTITTEDHNTSTVDADLLVTGVTSRAQIGTLCANCAGPGVRLHFLGGADQEIIHAAGPQLGLTQPGMTVVCGDSHTSTHSAFGALAFGIDISQVEHILATQTLPTAPFKTTSATIDGDLPSDSRAKDIILTVTVRAGTNGAQRYVIKYHGRATEQLSMETRMTICNMSIEGGARTGTITPDQTTFDYLKDRPYASISEDRDAIVKYWFSLRADPNAVLNTEVVPRAEDIEPFVTWGINPGQGLPLSARVPDPENIADVTERLVVERVLEYVDLAPGTPLHDTKVDTVFISSCTSGRIEDLRATAEVVRGRKKTEGLHMLVVLASAWVCLQVEVEGLNRIFTSFGTEWRNAGCSMYLATNLDKLSSGERVASTSNRSFEGR